MVVNQELSYRKNAKKGQGGGEKVVVCWMDVNQELVVVCWVDVNQKLEVIAKMQKRWGRGGVKVDVNQELKLL